MSRGLARVIRGKWWMLLLAVVVCLGGVGWWRYGGERSAPRTGGLRTASVERRDLVQVVEATGRLEAEGRFVVSPVIEGRLAEVFVEAGDAVEPGDRLARLDAEGLAFEVKALEATKAAARANVAKADAALKEAKKKADRLARLAERGQTSRAQLEAAKAELETAEAHLRAASAEAEGAKARLEAARFSVERSELRAPKAGVVLRVQAREGALVGPSGPALFELSVGLDPLLVRANVGEADVGRLKKGQRATFEVPAFPGEGFEGTVEDVGLVATQEGYVSAYPVVLEVRNPEGRLRPGMTAAVRFEVASKEDALVVREAALRYVPPGAPPAPARSRVFVARGGSLEAVPIDRGLSDGAFQEVRPREQGALREGDRVVIGEALRGEDAEGAGLSLGGDG